MSKVWKVNKNDLKILGNLYNNQEGLRVKTLQKLTGFGTKLLYKRLSLMKSSGLLENIFPVWKLANGQVEKCRNLLKDDNIFEIHNTSWIVKLMKTPSWWSKRKNYLIRLKGWQFKNIDFGKANSNPYQQLVNENFVMQCYPESIIIIARKRYSSKNPYETIIGAITDVMDMMDWFCERFKFNFFSDGIPHIQIRNNDFNRIKDHIAEFCRKNKNGFLVEIDERRKVWVDMSEPFGKESNYPEAQEKLERVTRDILTESPPLPSEMNNTLKLIRENLSEFESIIKNVSEHEIMIAQTMGQRAKNVDRIFKDIDRVYAELMEIKMEINRLKGNI